MSLKTISGSESLLRNADVGHMLELREKASSAESEIIRLKETINRLQNLCTTDHESKAAFISRVMEVLLHNDLAESSPDKL